MSIFKEGGMMEKFNSFRFRMGRQPPDVFLRGRENPGPSSKRSMILMAPFSSILSRPCSRARRCDGVSEMKVHRGARVSLRDPVNSIR